MKNNHLSLGFSLIELIVAISIISILASFAIPTFKDVMDNQRVKNASFELYASLMSSRSEALKRNDNVTIAAVSGVWQNGWQITATDDTPIKKHAALNKIVVSNAPASLVFKKNGRISGASPSFQFDTDPTNTNYSRCVSVDLSGLPRTKKGSC